ncbi:hypothetical protein BOQ62_09820 [Chryseobacterium sp. CH21]|uniref:hypothetical protein n=1 Tax=Chryseobacterium sp. CH21 TaxID=713556 RepID=UPI00100A64CC|nr:hypothetical protein [Chryseobacterium sp. CH21]RXM39833.1 hypothetical protein BOQ62_09820 [Chryseobacterium sp. CH21]
MKQLHIISFNDPYPPTYGGIIDVYYKIKALSALGIKIHLHCFIDQTPDKIDPEIEEITENVFFIKRKRIHCSIFQEHLSLLPSEILKY